MISFHCGEMISDDFTGIIFSHGLIESERTLGVGLSSRIKKHFVNEAIKFVGALH